MSVNGWLSDNVIVSICSMIGGAASAMLAARVKRVVSRDDMLLRGWDQYTGRLATRIDALEKELDRREQECRRRLDDADQRLDGTEARLRDCEAGRAALRLRLDELERRLPGKWPVPPDNTDENQT